MKSTFLYAAIADAQGTIRATDTKTAALLVILALPLTRLGCIFRECHGLCASSDPMIRYISYLLVAAFSIFWLLAFRSAIRALNPVDNPSDHVTGNKPSGVFYSGDLFKPTFSDTHFCCRTKSKHGLDIQISRLPTDEIQEVNELAYEHLKLVYIRTIKHERITFAFKLGTAWIALGGLIWLLSLVLNGH